MDPEIDEGPDPGLSGSRRVVSSLIPGGRFAVMYSVGLID